MQGQVSLAKGPGWWFRLALFVLCTCVAAVSATACVLPDNLRTDIRPGDPDLPTEIVASVAVTDLLDVDDAGQQLNIDMFVTLEWIDERLAALAGCRVPLSEVWRPRVRLMNSSNLRQAARNAQNQVAIHEGGRVEYVQRFTGLISSYHNLRDFPFDKHSFRIDMGAARDGLHQIAFLADDDNTWISDRLNIEGWDVTGVSLSVQPFYWRANTLDFSVVSLQIDASRNPEFYIYRVLLLLVIVVAMSWVIFWVPPEKYEFQIGLGATSMLTIIAFNLALSSQLPPVGYLTIMDKIVSWSIFLVLMAIVEALIAGRLVMAGKEDIAHGLDRASRYLFPLFLLGGWALIIWG